MPISNESSGIDAGLTDRPQIRRRIPKSQRRRDGLIQFAKDVTSQNGEDGVIAKLFELIPPRPSSSRDHRVCIDVGAWDGQHLSNTYTLLVGSESSTNGQAGSVPVPPRQEWKGLLIEADIERFQELKALHDPLGNTCCNITVSGDDSLTGANRDKSLVSILQTSQVAGKRLPIDLDLLSIDVDGSDYWLLYDVWEKSAFRPLVVCIEANPTMPNDVIYIPPRDDKIRHGASVAALVELAENHGYVLVETTVYNCFFVPLEVYEATPLKELVPDTSIESLHEITMGTSLYQLYDGTLKLWGCRKLLWHRVGIKEEQLQMLPPEKRIFPFAPSVDALPENVVDMCAYCQTSDEEADTSRTRREACAAALLSQLVADGFALVRGTGISQELCEGALSMTHGFLHRADESARRSCLAEDRARRGYAPMCTENFASLIGNEGPNDLVRKFRLGPKKFSSDSPLHRPNVWPSADTWSEAGEFQSTIEQYYEEACSTASAIVKAIGDGLVKSKPDLASSLNSVVNTDGRSQHHSSILTLLGYRKGARHKKTQKKRFIHPLVAGHTDVGIITMLLFDGGTKSCAGLQRQDLHAKEGEKNFVDVSLPSNVPEDPIFIINIADCLSELSQNQLPSTLHRVMPTGGEDPRNCLALFMGLDPEALLHLQDRTIAYEEWRKARIAESQAILRAKRSDKPGAMFN